MRPAPRCWRAKGGCPTLWWPVSAAGSNAIGMFHPFVDDASVEIHGVEAAGEGVDTPRHAATLSKGSPGVLHGARSYLLQDQDARSSRPIPFPPDWIIPASGRTFLAQGYRPGEILFRHRQGGADAFMLLSKLEGIIPALESAHALAHVAKVAPGQMKPDQAYRRLPVGPRRQGCLLGRQCAAGEKL